jgi:hypothetical protein
MAFDVASAMHSRFRRQFFKRTAVLAIVAGLHLLVAVMLMSRKAGPIADATAIAPTLWLIFPDDVAEEQPAEQEIPGDTRRAAPMPEPAGLSSQPPSAPEPDTSRQISDWAAAAERAAARIAMEESREPLPRPPDRPAQPFAWDKAHTERFSAPASGGMLIRLSDRCEVVFLPLPTGGCALGKIEPRGDLFDQMTAPVNLGDWKE